MTTVLVCGHSFIRRYREYLETSCLYRGRGILREFGRNYNFREQVNVHVDGRGGLTANRAGLSYIRDRIFVTTPQVLVLELGTNDLVNGANPSELASDLIRFIEDITHSTSVECVVVCQVVQRYRTRRISHDEFDNTRLSYNFQLQQAARNNQRIWTHKHDRSVLVNLNSVSGDQIHITSGSGLRLYHFSIRKAIIAGLNRLMRIQHS